MMVELVQQHDDSPSVYHEGGGRRYGFHHWAVFAADFDAELERLRSPAASTEAFSDRLPSGARIVYVDAAPETCRA